MNSPTKSHCGTRSWEMTEAMSMACFKNVNGRPVRSAPAKVPASQHAVSQNPARHQRAKKNAASGSTHKYHAPCIHADSANTMQVRTSLSFGGVCVTGFDQENRMAMSTPSV